MTTPQIIAAFDHVKQHFPQVTQVFFGRGNHWFYCDDDFDGPDFGEGGPIDIGLLEDAADTAPCLPFAYAP